MTKQNEEHILPIVDIPDGVVFNNKESYITGAADQHKAALVILKRDYISKEKHKEIVREILEEAHEIIDDDTFDAVNRWCELKQKYLPKEITNEADKNK